MSFSRVCLRRILETNKFFPISSVGRRYKTKEVLISDPNIDDVASAPKFFEEILNFEKRQQRRKPKIEPFVKNLFTSKVDTDILAYPEVLDKEDLLALDGRLDKIDGIIGDMGASDQSIMEMFKTQRIYSAPLTVFRGGLESNFTERMRFLEEIAKFRTSIALLLNTQWAGIEAVKAAFTEEGFDTFSSHISGGEHPVRILYRERIAEDLDVPDIRLVSKMNPSGEWLLSGEKVMDYVVESKLNKEFLIVLSCVQHNFVQGFLVYPNAPGVTYKETSILFSDTPAIMLGEDIIKKMTDIIQSGNLFLMPTTPINQGLSQKRLGEATIALGLLKETIHFVLQQTRGKYFCNKQYCEHQLFENILVDAITSVYKIESMIYFTTGLQDGYEDPDIEVEAMMCRIFATREAVRIIYKFLYNMKPFGIEGNLEEYLNDANNILYNEQNENLSTYSTILGIAYAGFSMKDEVKKLRNPAFHPLYVLKRMLFDRRQVKDNPVMSLQLKNYFHQSLMEASDNLEYSVLRISYAVETAFITHGQDIIHEHRDLERISNIVIEVFAMLASLARGSRSYCIGVRNANRELLQCQLICSEGKKELQKYVTQVIEGKYINNDEGVLNLAKDSVSMKRYPAEHPLTRVFF